MFREKPANFKNIAAKDEKVVESLTISPEEYAERVERLTAMGKVIGDDFGLNVKVGRERGWRYIFNNNTIEIDPLDVAEKKMEYCFGLIAHEGAHRKISRVDFIPKKIWQETGFSFLMNAIEDPRVNNWESAKHEGADDWLNLVYDEDLPRIEKKVEEESGHIPDFLKYGFEIIRYWHTGKFSDNLPVKVKEVLDKTIAFAEKAYESIPEKEPTDYEIADKAKKMYKIVYSAIWPEYQKLIEKSLDDEMLKLLVEMLKKDMEKNEGKEKPDSKPEKQEESEDSGNKNGLEPEKKESDGKETKEDENNISGNPETGENNNEQKDGSEKKEPQKNDEENKDAGEIKEDPLLAKAREIAGSEKREDKEKKEEARKRAKDLMDQIEKKIVAEIKGKFSKQPETLAEERERIKREEAERIEARKREDELLAIKKEINEKLEKSKSEYEKAYEEVKEYIDKVSDEIINLAVADRFPKFKKSFPGEKIRLKGAMAWKAKKEYKEVFEKKLTAERKRFSFFLLVDLSGSMMDKINDTFKGAVLFTEALNKVGSVLGNTKVAIYGFQDVLIKYKNFEDKLNQEIRSKISIMKKEVRDLGIHNNSYANSDGYCVDEAAKILKKEEGEKFLFVLSDGQPAPARRTDKYRYLSSDEELTRVIEDLADEKKIRILGIGLGPSTDFVAEYYNNKLPGVENMPNVNIKTLAEKLGKKLQQIIKD